MGRRLETILHFTPQTRILKNLFHPGGDVPAGQPQDQQQPLRNRLVMASPFFWGTSPAESTSIHNDPQSWPNPFFEAPTGHRSVYTLF